MFIEKVVNLVLRRILIFPLMLLRRVMNQFCVPRLTYGVCTLDANVSLLANIPPQLWSSIITQHVLVEERIYIHFGGT